MFTGAGEEIEKRNISFAVRVKEREKDENLFFLLLLYYPLRVEFSSNRRGVNHSPPSYPTTEKDLTPCSPM